MRMRMRMLMRMHMICVCICVCKFLNHPESYQNHSKFIQNDAKMEPGWSQNGAKVLLWSSLACLWESICFFDAPKCSKWSQKGSKMEPKSEKMWEKTSTKTEAFPDSHFSWFLMILEIFLGWFLDPLDPWFWASRLGKTMIFTFSTFQNRPRKKAFAKTLKDADVHWFGE